MKNSDKKFVIPFVGLKQGIHTFEFDIEDLFFESYEYSLVSSGSVKITMELDKKETMMIAQFELKGVVGTMCDRCDTPVQVSIKGSYKLIYKFGFEESEDENLIVLHPEEYELNVKDSIYEFITISLPTKVVHKVGECDEEMMNLIGKYVVIPEESDEDFDDESFDLDDEDFDFDDDEDFDDNEDFDEDED